VASINLGVVGCIAASAATVSAPTGVSIAEDASSGQNNAFRIVDSGEDIMTVDYSDWSSATSESFGTQYEKEVSAGDLGDFNTYGVINMDVYAYLRATGATSFSWSGAVYSNSFGSGSGAPSASISGAGGAGQDGTSSGVGIRLIISPGSGRGGANNWPSAGMNVIYKLTGTATNSGGSTAADLYLKYSFTS
tara:strand:+ start:18939 stop:19514 length:576 start_codon:yes stop_codon:yes gene_type:complete